MLLSWGVAGNGPGGGSRVSARLLQSIFSGWWCVCWLQEAECAGLKQKAAEQASALSMLEKKCHALAAEKHELQTKVRAVTHHLQSCSAGSVTACCLSLLIPDPVPNTTCYKPDYSPRSMHLGVLADILTLRIGLACLQDDDVANDIQRLTQENSALKTLVKQLYREIAKLEAFKRSVLHTVQVRLLRLSHGSSPSQSSGSWRAACCMVSSHRLATHVESRGLAVSG